MSRFGEPLDAGAIEWKYQLLRTVAPYRDLPLLLSGGVDSGTLLAALLELGAKPTCYAYRLASRPCPDYDVAARMAQDEGLDFSGIVIPDHPGRAEVEAREIIGFLETSRKTSVQCSIPIAWMAQQVRWDGHDGALVGTGAVVLDDRRVMTILAKDGEEAAREYRRDKLEDRHRDCGTGRMHETARRFGVPLEEPYSDEPLRSHALALDVAELNRGPKGYGQKGIAVRAFPNWWRRRGYYRRNSPLQVNSGLREWQAELLKDERLNPGGKFRDVVAIYNRMLESERSPSLI